MLHAFMREDQGSSGRLDRGSFAKALGRVFASLQPVVPQPDATWFDRVYESYAAKCGGGVSLRAMEDAAKQFVSHHQKKRESAKQTEAPSHQPSPAKQPTGPSVGQTVGDRHQKKVIEEMSPKGYALPQQVPFSPSAPRPGYGKAVELASAVMCPMKQGSNVLEDYIMDDKKLGEGSFGQVCVVTQKLTGQKRAMKRVGIQTEMDKRLVETEIQLLKKLDHGNIMRLSECYVDGTSLFLISELCEGGTLLQGFARHGSESKAASAVRQILSATAFLSLGFFRHVDRWMLLGRMAGDCELVARLSSTPRGAAAEQRAGTAAAWCQLWASLAAPFPKRSDASRFGVSDQFHQDWQLDVHDKVEQVKVAPGGKGEAVISWLTTDRHLPSVVRYKSARSLFSEVAQGEVNVYTTQICLPNSEVMTDPLLGPPNIPLNYDELTALLNTSAFLPKESDSWRFLGPKDDPWDFLEKTNFCVDYKNPKAYYTSPYIHTVTLAGLSGSSEYSFRPEGSSRTFTFTTPPEAGAGTSRPLRVGVWADIGITNVSFGVMSQMLRLAPELLMSVGDPSYADGWAERWDIFGIMMEPLMSSRYHLAVAGNHEMTQNNAVDLIHRYPMPFRPSGAPNPLMFAYETGLLYVLGLPGSYAATDPSSAQWAFAAEKLMAVDRQRTPWVVVMFHTPWYNSNNAHFGEALKHQWDMESLFYQYGVDLVFNGHVHSYERSFPVYNNTVDDCGTVHIVVGDGGNYEGPALYEGHPPGWRQPQPLWSAFREASYGPGLLTIYNSSHAEWRWHRVACVFQNKHHEPVKLTKFTYDGSTKSLGRTRPISAYYWDGVSGPADGPKCSTEGDNSKQAFEASDVVMLVRNPQRCSNKRWKKPPSAAATEFSFRGMTPHLAVLSAASILATLISLRSRMPWSSPARQNGERLLSSPV